MPFTSPLEGFGVIAQKYISRSISSTVYPKLPFLSAVAGIMLGNNNAQTLQLGRPGVGALIRGGDVKPAERLTLGATNSYNPRRQVFQTSNTKVMGAFDTMPTVANPTTNSQGQATLAAADFKFTMFITPILLWHELKDRAQNQSSQEGRGIALAQLVDEATEVAMQEHVKAINTSIWSGNPTNQGMDPWDDLLGIAQIMSASNIYGNVDRSIAGNSDWRAQVDSSYTSIDIVKLVDDANLASEGTSISSGMNIYGMGANLCVTTAVLFAKFKAQILNSGGVVLQNGLPKMGELGVKTEALKKDNVYIIYDPTQTANYVDFWDTNALRIAFHPSYNLKVKPFVDISGQSEGAKRADQAFIESKLMFSNDAPGKSAVRYSSITG